MSLKGFTFDKGLSNDKNYKSHQVVSINTEDSSLTGLGIEYIGAKPAPYQKKKSLEQVKIVERRLKLTARLRAKLNEKSNDSSATEN